MGPNIATIVATVPQKPATCHPIKLARSGPSAVRDREIIRELCSRHPVVDVNHLALHIGHDGNTAANRREG